MTRVGSCEPFIGTCEAKAFHFEMCSCDDVATIATRIAYCRCVHRKILTNIDNVNSELLGSADLGSSDRV